MEESLRVILVEDDLETASEIEKRFLEIKECRLLVVKSLREVLRRPVSHTPQVIILANGSGTEQNLSEVRRRWPEAYVIVSINPAQNLSGKIRIAGAHDCVMKGEDHVNSLMQATKRAMIRIAERGDLSSSSGSTCTLLELDDRLPDIVFNLDLTGRILHLNHAVSALLGYDPCELIGTTFHDLFAVDSCRMRYADYLRNLGLETHFRDTVALRNGLGVEEDFEIDCAFMDGDHVYGVARKKGIVEGFQFAGEVETDDCEEAMPPQLGHYRIVRLLGAGGMGRVYLGVDDALDRPVAVKVIADTLAGDEEHLARFRQEARILASIVHPNIALVYLYGTDPSPYFCMEYLPGGSLRDVIRKKGVLPPKVAASYAHQVALGLNEALSKKVIHLDIKPSNLMLTQDDRIKIVDFGLSRTNDLDLDDGQIVGTPFYVAPEQVCAGIADYRSDIYSLGITLFEMVYGFLPFYGHTIKETFRMCLECDLPPRETLNPAVPIELDQIIRKMAARDPLQRYASYTELISDLNAFLKRGNEGKRSLRMLKPASRLWGNLHDRPFSEVLSEIITKSMTGNLTISWMGLKKEVRFRNGRITGVISNQEGESILDVAVRNSHLTVQEARELRSRSRQSADQLLSTDPLMSPKMTRELRQLAKRVLQGLFRLDVGDFVFEEGFFAEQYGLKVDSMELLADGIKQSMYIDTIRRRTYEGKCQIELTPDFSSILGRIQLPSSDYYPLFRIDGKIHFEQLLSICRIPEQDFCRLVYLFQCLGVLELESTPPDQKDPACIPAQRKPASDILLNHNEPAANSRLAASSRR